MDSKIKIRYFDNWANEGPAIFFAADSLSIKKLEALFTIIASSEIEQIELNSLDFIEPYFGIRIDASAGMLDLGVVKKGNSFKWVATPSEWEKYAVMLSCFTSINKGHQYLETGSDYNNHIQIIASVNEYPSDWNAWTEE